MGLGVEKKDTVYVVGAGASQEAGLPTGEKLKSRISELLNMDFSISKQTSGDFGIKSALSQLVKMSGSTEDMNLYMDECRMISKNMPLAISIDHFIDSQRKNKKLVRCGKLAILKSILSAERHSLLYFKEDRPLNFSSLEGTWFLALFRSLTENCGAADLMDRFEDVTLIIFNYDRCIEHFLFNALKSYYKLEEMQAAELISCLTIIHPYGTVGSLEWQNDQSETVVQFGGQLHESRLIEFSEKIRTFTEGADSSYMRLVVGSMRFTKRLVFLGFAFHPFNMKLLGGNSTERYLNAYDIECYVTAYGASMNDMELIKKSISYLYESEKKVTITVAVTKCGDFFKDYSRSLGYSQR